MCEMKAEERTLGMPKNRIMQPSLPEHEEQTERTCPVQDLSVLVLKFDDPGIVH